jgi:hypothetical protein
VTPRRKVFTIVGLAIATAVALLIVRAYQRPEFMIEMLSMVGLC